MLLHRWHSVVLSVAIPIDQQMLLLLLLQLFVPNAPRSSRSNQQILIVVVQLVIANRSESVSIPSVLATVLQMIVVRMNQEGVVTTQNQFVKKYANVFQK